MQTTYKLVGFLTSAVLVFGFLAAVATPLPAQAQDIQVLSADPSSAPQGTLNLNVSIKGKNFKRGAVARFFVTGTANPGGIQVNSTAYRGTNEVVANINVADTADISKFDIQVMNSDGRTGKGIELFSVAPKTRDSVIYLQATIRDSAEDNVRSDGLGPYVSGGDISAQISVDGHLSFGFPPGCGRTIRLDFTDRLRAGDPGLFPPGPDDPVVGLSFFTMQLEGENFRMMMPGQVSIVHLWFQPNSASGLDFWLTGGGNTPIPAGQVGGHVQVTALDTNSDGRVDRWIVEPLPNTDSKFQLLRRVREKTSPPSVVNKDYGDFRMPFAVIFDRLN